MAFILRFLSVMNSSDRTNFSTNPSRLDSSRNFHYWNTRFYEGVIYNRAAATQKDAGTSVAGAILAMNKYGCCPERFSDSLETLTYPDLSGKFTYKGHPYSSKTFQLQPTPEDYRFALDTDLYGIEEREMFSYADGCMHDNPYAYVGKRLKYQDLSSAFRKNTPKIKNTAAEIASVISNIRGALRENKPIYFGMLINSSFYKNKKGFIQTPPLTRFVSSGGHAIAIVGYGPYDTSDPNKNYLKFINSWGLKWGDGGFGYLAEDYVGNVNIFQVEAFSVSLPTSISPPIPSVSVKGSEKGFEYARTTGTKKKKKRNIVSYTQHF